MSYTIKKTDGTTLATVDEGEIDTTSASVALVGRNTANYGLAHAENFIKLTESFANTVPPLAPMKGQLWYDTATQMLKVYDNNSWNTISGNTGGGTGGAISTAHSVDVAGTSVLVMVAGSEIVMVISPKDIANSLLPDNVSIGGTVLPFRARYPSGVQAGTTLATDVDDFVYRGHTEVADQSHFVGGGTPFGAVTYIDLGTNTIVLNIVNNVVVGAWSQVVVPQGQLPAQITVGGVDCTFNPYFSGGLQVGLTIADGFKVTGNVVSQNITDQITAEGSARASAVSQLYTYIDGDGNAQAGKITTLQSTFITAAQNAGGTSITSVADAVAHMYTVAGSGTSGADAVTQLKAEFTTAMNNGGLISSSYADALSKLSVAASTASATSTNLTSLRSEIQNGVTGATSAADAIQKLWTAATTEAGAIAGWSVDLNADGAVAGLQLIADGTQKASSFRVLADKFVIHHAGTPGIIPFEVRNNSVYMKNAVIEDLTVGGEKIKPSAITQSATIHQNVGTNIPNWNAAGCAVTFNASLSNAIPANSRTIVTMNLNGYQTGSNDDPWYIYLYREVTSGGIRVIQQVGPPAVISFVSKSGPQTQGWTWADENINEENGQNPIRYFLGKAPYISGQNGYMTQATMVAFLGKK